MNSKEIIKHLNLEPHIEGGYFRRNYQSASSFTTAEGDSRYLMTSIYYLLSDESPIGHLHRNRSDILHFFQHGGPIDYCLLHPDGRLEQLTLGPDLEAGHQLQLCVPGACWKASRLQSGDYGLISEAVAPGFDYADMELATEEKLAMQFPQLFDQLWPRLHAFIAC
jgi:hypothetical protein